ncbi:MAG: tyrosine-type recombinase/integrase [Pseudomonadales bacterium]|nr:tyrosine-type recombinase/integrase [Pseudomonadales bacterium]
MDKPAWPTGIRPCGNGIRIKIWKAGKLYYSETVPGDPYRPADLAAAVRRREWLESRKRLGLSITTDDTTAENELFSEMAQDYLNTLDAKTSTATDYLRILNRYWMPKFGNMLKTEVTTRMVKRELASMNVGRKTKKNILVPLRGAFDHGEVDPNPVAASLLKKAIRKTQKPPVERYTLEERRRLIEHLQDQPKVYFAVLFGCGLRPGEALGLTWNDYDGEFLHITKQITRRRLEPTTKNYQERKVYVPSWVRPLLNNLPTRFKRGHVFLNTIDTPCLDTDCFNGPWKDAHKALKFRYRIPYTCRHTRAAELLSTGVEPGDAAGQMGHTLDVFYRTYAEWIEEYSNKKKDISRFEGATDKIPTKENGAENN